MAYRTRNITFEARMFWFMAYKKRNIKRNIKLEARFLWLPYRTRNITIRACLFWFMACTTRNITFEARLLWFMTYRTRRYITFEGRFFCLKLVEPGILHLSHASSDLVLYGLKNEEY